MTNKTVQTGLTAIVLAAGSGSRMKSSAPKQYTLIEGKTVLQHSLDTLLAEPRIQRIIVVVAPSDIVGQKLRFDDERIQVARVGGFTRAMSVKNGLSYATFTSNEWVLVHDSARPCLLTSDVTKLIDECMSRDRGGILAVPVNDTLKKENGDRIITRTVSRESMWAAQTPQMFRAFDLLEALDKAGDAVTDEASAMELAGQKPILVEGTQTNLKITHQMDLWMAKAIMRYRKDISSGN